MKADKSYITLTDASFQKEVLESTQPVLVEFGADWCGSCHMIAPAIEELAADFEGQIKIALPQKLSVKSLALTNWNSAMCS